jgi:hypothetical protein
MKKSMSGGVIMVFIILGVCTITMFLEYFDFDFCSSNIYTQTALEKEIQYQQSQEMNASLNNLCESIMNKDVFIFIILLTSAIFFIIMWYLWEDYKINTRRKRRI